MKTQALFYAQVAKPPPDDHCECDEFRHLFARPAQQRGGMDSQLRTFGGIALLVACGLAAWVYQLFL